MGRGNRVSTGFSGHDTNFGSAVLRSNVDLIIGLAAEMLLVLSSTPIIELVCRFSKYSLRTDQAENTDSLLDACDVESRVPL
jgi:hypothetical protein